MRFRTQAWRTVVQPGFLTNQGAKKAFPFALGESRFPLGRTEKPSWIWALQAWVLTPANPVHIHSLARKHVNVCLHLLVPAGIASFKLPYGDSLFLSRSK